MKKISISAAITISALVAAATVSLTYMYAMERFNAKVADINERQAMYEKLYEIDQKVRHDGVVELDETALTDGICAGYAAGLGDANAKYQSAERYQQYLQLGSEKNVGPGIRTVQDADGNMEVVEVVPGSAAESAGIKKGDIILAVDGKEVVRITYGEALTRLDGAKGSTVSLKVMRDIQNAKDDEKKKIRILDFKIVRSEYSPQNITFHVINGNVAHIKIRGFQSDTADEMHKIIAKVQKKNVCGVVLDLRECASGSVEDMIHTAKSFLPANSSVEYVDASGKTPVKYPDGNQYLGLPLVVLTDNTTYGAAEVLAADIRGGKSGTVVGTVTAGGASQQETIQLSDGSALTLTVGYYADMNGNSLYGKGLSPDREVLLTEEKKSLLIRDRLSPEEDTQLQTAVTVLAENGAAVSRLPGIAYQKEKLKEKEK